MSDQLDNESYDDIDEFEEEEEYGGDSFRKWGVIAGIGVAVVCVGLLVVLWFGKSVFMAPIAQWLASATPTPTQTPPPTMTFTPFPTPTETQVATELPTAAPAIQPPPEIMAQVEGPPVLQENFADNARAWTGMGSNSEFLIQENHFILKSNQLAAPAAADCAGDCGPYKDGYYYESGVMDERASGFGYGLIFAINDAKNSYYAYKIRTGQNQYGLFKLVNGSWSPLIDWTPTPALLPSPQTNVLGASLQDKNITLFLNGARLASYVDEKPYNEGRIGYMVDQDGVRLFASNAKVYQLRKATGTPGGQAAAPAGQPTFTPARPTQAVKFTFTPTPAGSCPTGTPKNTWILQITNINQSKKEVTINGVSHDLKDMFSVFYLTLNVDYTVELGNKTYDYNFPACKIVYLKVK